MLYRALNINFITTSEIIRSIFFYLLKRSLFFCKTQPIWIWMSFWIYQMTEPNRFHFYIMIFMCVVFEHSRNSYCIGKMRVTWHMSSRLFKGFCSTTLKYDDIKGKNATNSLFCFYIFLCIVDAFHNSISKCMQMYSTLLLFRLTIMQ